MSNKTMDCKIVGIKTVVEEKEDKEINEFVVITLKARDDTKITIKELVSDTVGFVMGEKVTIEIKKVQKTIGESVN